MFGFVALTILANLALVGLRLYRNLQKNIQKAKQTGLPYVISREFRNLLSFGFSSLCKPMFQSNFDNENTAQVAFRGLTIT